eukprot:6195712-Pleurochrysis_carterae.AAC.4
MPLAGVVAEASVCVARVMLSYGPLLSATAELFSADELPLKLPLLPQLLDVVSGITRFIFLGEARRPCPLPLLLSR